MERRLMDRRNLPVKAIVSFTDKTSENYKTLNISCDGAFLITDQAKPVGTRVVMSLLMEDKPEEQTQNNSLIKLEGTVRRRAAYGMAVCFDHRQQFPGI